MTATLPWLRIAVISLSSILIVFSLIGGVQNYSPVPYWDMWGATLNFVRTFDEAPIAKLFALHNEHRIVLSRLLFLIDYNLFGGHHVFLVLCNFLFAFAIWGVFARCLFKLNLEHQDPRDVWLMVFGLGAWLFLWCQKVNFNWAFQSQFFLAQLLPLCAFLSLSHSNTQGRNWGPSYWAAFALGWLSVLTMANGLMVLPLLAAGAVLLRMTILQVSVFAMNAVIAAYIYLSDYRTPETHGDGFSAFFADPIGVLHYTFSYLGNVGVYLAGPFSFIKFVCLIAGICLSLCAAGLLLSAVRKRPSDPVSPALLLFIIFVGAGAFVTANGRLGFGIGSAFSSRYTTPVLMAWAALFCLYSPAFLRVYTASSRNTYTTLGLAVFGLCLLFVSQTRALLPVHDLHHEKAVAVLAAELGIPDQSTVSVVHPKAAYLVYLAQQTSDEDIGIFSQRPHRNLFEMMGTRREIEVSKSCAGGILETYRVEGRSDVQRLIGWQHSTRFNPQDRRILFLDQNSTIVGAALLGRASPELVSAYGKKASRAGFTGYVQTEALSQSLTVLSEHCFWQSHP